MTSSFTRHLEQDARLVMLTELYRQPAGRLSEAGLEQALMAFGHDRSRDWTRTQMREMEELGAIVLTEAHTVLIAQITKAGVKHVLRQSKIEGIKEPVVGV
ncbi:hypothetical protein [Methylobacterium sp. WL6]|uniref:VpaChn25_0724 family phage protein n=1 Tax=Methylobacterium sp. WL6 TaxID=2603901 RepID=UPI0011CA74B5|nr:hypothetical protein [Methylobacterium sp. WL6]TXN71641.1 hypothetical protein FV230_07790 [Methylobacterium sp. WL6]